MSIDQPERMSFRFLDGFDLEFSSRSVAREDRERLALSYWQTHPRICFFLKTPYQGALVDMGCGAGGMAFARTTYQPRREDVRLLGCDIEVGPHQHLYEKVRIGDFDKLSLDFENQSVDAVLASHFFEHIRDTGKYFSDMMRIMKPGAEMYIEIPSKHSKKLPSADVLRNQNLPVIASNFFEDHTHIDTYSQEELRHLCEGAGFKTIAAGYISSPGYENELLAYGYKFQDQELAVYGLWSKLLWAHYIVVRKPTTFDRVLPTLSD